MQIQNFSWNCQAIWMYQAISYIVVAYILLWSLIMVTIKTRHIFINISQTEHFPAVKFDMGYEKNMSFLVIPKSPNLWKKVEKTGLGSFNWSITYNFRAEYASFNLIHTLLNWLFYSTFFFVEHKASFHWTEHGKLNHIVYSYTLYH